MIRNALQQLYFACGVLAGACLVAVAGFVLYSIGGGLFGYVARSADDFAGYAMLASSFLALAHTFGKGEHIRVTILIQRLRGRARRVGEIWCLAIAAALSGYLAWFSIKTTWVSYEIGDVSTGLVPVPLWIPQVAMALGASVLFIAVLEQLIVALAGGVLMQDAGADDVHIER
ncbi:TRAP transporter small permease [Desertibaculum subflavum]|uniref:TRAP transporter small permease n=1 Tax=Desertibaculum subflavum TaxID=2268458 RepID=UPI000E6740A0